MEDARDRISDGVRFFVGIDSDAVVVTTSLPASYRCVLHSQ